MTKRHTHGQYKDGHSMVAFCTVCGAEGLKLLEDCPTELIHSFTIINSTPADFDKGLDEQNEADT